MNVPREVFREYDIRGVVGEQLTPELAHAIGRAVVTMTAQRVTGQVRLAIGRDNRPSGELLSRATRDGVAAAGGVAVDVGPLPTPALYFALHDLDVDGGIQVTGSHNPPEFNGFKMVVSGDTVYGAAIQEIRTLIENDSSYDGAGSLEADGSVLERYRLAIVERNGPLSRPMKAVVDCGNGVMSLAAVETLTQVGADVVALFCESDGTFPNHHPDPTVPENLVDLQEAVRRTQADLGIAFDGDGDRIGVVDEHGTMILGDRLLALFGRDLADRFGAGHTVIYDVKCSDLLASDLEQHGLKPVMWKTGHSLLKVKMKEVGAPLAGEMSGHVFFGADYYGFDDALFAAARLLSYLARQSGSLSAQFASFPDRASTPELRVNCPEDRKFEIVSRAAEHFGRMYDTNTLDGVRITFPEGWGLLRASNTQPVLVMRFEASTPELLSSYRGEVEGWLRSQGVKP
jgi:phosphomannomutase / phosphoglucomutase